MRGGGRGKGAGEGENESERKRTDLALPEVGKESLSLQCLT